MFSRFSRFSVQKLSGGFRLPMSISRNLSSSIPRVPALRLGDVVPDFTQDTTEGRLNFYDFIEGSWTILFSHPKAFTPVCTTELGFMAGMNTEFKKRDTKIIAISCDPVEENLSWSNDIQEVTGNKVNYPIICDADRHVSVKFNMLMEVGSILS